MFRKICSASLRCFLTTIFALNAFAFDVRSSDKYAAGENLTQYVNPFVGTGKMKMPDLLGGNSSANTFPGANVPFGMVQFSPDTVNGFAKDRAGSYSRSFARAAREFRRESGRARNSSDARSELILHRQLTRE
jgi:putative alpha-1,2-mannosidase